MPDISLDLMNSSFSHEHSWKKASQAIKKKKSSGYYISGQGLVQMQSGKSSIWKSYLLAEYYRSLIFWSYSRHRQNYSLGLGSKKISCMDFSRQKCGPTLDKS